MLWRTYANWLECKTSPHTFRMKYQTLCLELCCIFFYFILSWTCSLQLWIPIEFMSFLTWSSHLLFGLSLLMSGIQSVIFFTLLILFILLMCAYYRIFCAFINLTMSSLLNISTILWVFSLLNSLFFVVSCNFLIFFSHHWSDLFYTPLFCSSVDLLTFHDELEVIICFISCS